ncbi:MAG: error-prone polymerase, partial [Pseudomonadota bacterium]
QHWLGDRAGLAVQRLHHPGEEDRIAELLQVQQLTGLPLVATGDVLMHLRSRKPLQDTLSATRLNRPLSACGRLLQPNAEQHLRARARLAQLYAPAWLQASVDWAARCTFSLAELRYEYPREIVPAGHSPASWLRALTAAGAAWRYPPPGTPRRQPALWQQARAGLADDDAANPSVVNAADAPPIDLPPHMPEAVRKQVEHELALIRQLDYEPYFLTVADIVMWAREQGILCQGRGSAANSAVCFCLGITEVDPARMQTLFERFISAERNEPPDIDVDFEHQRREEVIQYIYKKYGRHRAALTGVMITYRPRSALRDAGRALGIDIDAINAVSKGQLSWKGVAADKLLEHGFDPEAPITRLWMELTTQLIGFPRHLSQHPGGFVIARDQIAQLVPVENAAMDHRSVIQWDKDDLDALKLLKVDILALGMLSAIRRALTLVSDKLGRPRSAALAQPDQAGPMELQDIPPEDPATYDMACRADTVGVFQIESRAQMSMLPRLKPRVFYDLVIEVAIVRPGPIQGGMVHPYLRRRNGEEPVDYPSAEVEQALSRTQGIPIFQEQVMQLAVLAADFTPGEADALRRAMAAWKRKGGLGPFHEKLVGRMVAKGYTEDFAERIFKQIQGFGEYGFPESHAASFALLVYISCWLKRHHPDAFLAALLNSQPMGFYAPAQLVRDAREHGVRVLPVDVMLSDWESTLVAEPVADSESSSPALAHAVSHPGHGPAEGAAAGTFHAPLRPVRLGLNRVHGLAADAGERIVRARDRGGPFRNADDLARRAALNAHELHCLADANALATLSGHRHQAAWAVAGIDTRAARATPLLAQRSAEGPHPASTRVPEGAGVDGEQALGRHGAAVRAPAPGGVEVKVDPTSAADVDDDALALPAPAETESLLADYRALGLTLGRHPLALLRPTLNAFKVQPASVLRQYPDGRLARASGLVTHRQRPGTAKGTVFVTLEDDTGGINIIVWPSIAAAQHRPLVSARLLTVFGQWQRQGDVMHLVARKLIDHSDLLHGLAGRSRDFR